MAETEGGAKELFHTITTHPALLITVLAGLGLVVYLLIKNSPQGASTAAPTVGSTGFNASSAPDYTAYQQGYDIGYQRASYSVPSPSSAANNQLNTPPPTTNPVPDHPQTTTTTTTPVQTTTINATNPQFSTAWSRSVWPSEPANSTSALPIWSSPNADWSQTVGGIPKNTQISIGQPVTGNYFGQAKTYYPVTYNGVTGYIGSWDVGVVQGQTSS